MGKHSEWRKIAKNVRRRRIRREAAAFRTKLEMEKQESRENSPSYQVWFREKQQFIKLQEMEELRLFKEQESLYEKRENEAKKQWEVLQTTRATSTTNVQARYECNTEQKHLQTIMNKEGLEKIREEKDQLVNEQIVLEQFNEFFDYDTNIHHELNYLYETKPGEILCPFFSRTATCRFGDRCSRNHRKPSISQILLIKNFYLHYSLDVKDSEHGDSALEFENYEIYNHFRAFFNDVVPEFEKYGAVQQFKVCCNKVLHLRGNVYVEYSNCKEALQSYHRFQGRFYAGKQLNVEFCMIESWKSAICGLFYKNQCPKGSTCNFLHVFRNPGNMFTKWDFKYKKVSRRKQSNTCNWNGIGTMSCKCTLN